MQLVDFHAVTRSINLETPSTLLWIGLLWSRAQNIKQTALILT